MTHDIIDDLQNLIGEELQKYHEEKIKRDLGEDTKPAQGLKKARIPKELLMQYFIYN